MANVNQHVYLKIQSMSIGFLGMLPKFFLRLSVLKLNLALILAESNSFINAIIIIQ